MVMAELSCGTSAACCGKLCIFAVLYERFTMTIQEIEAAIAELSQTEFWQLMERLDELKNERWDQEIARDVAAGRFDEVIERGKRDIAAGLGRPL